MNKFIRVMLITFVICLVVGGGVLIAGLAMGGTLYDATVVIGERDDDFFFQDFFSHGLFRFGHEDKDEDKGSHDAPTVNMLSVDAAGIRDLDISLRNCELQIRDSENDQLSVEIGDGEENYFSLFQDGEVLKVIDKRKNKSNLKTTHVLIRIPKNHVFEEVEMQLGAGDIEISRLAARELRMEGGAGSLTADYLIASDQLDADMGVGDFYIKKAEFGELELDCGVGGFEVGSCQLNGDADINGGVGQVEIGIIGEKHDFNYELSCGMGELEVFDDTYHSLGREKDIDNDAPYTISLECGVGRVRVYKANEGI